MIRVRIEVRVRVGLVRGAGLIIKSTFNARLRHYHCQQQQASYVDTLYDTTHCFTADEHFGAACSGDEDQPRPEVDSGRSSR